MCFEVARNGRHKTGDLRFHIDCATRNQLAIADLSRKGIDTPGRRVADRDDIGVSCKTEIWQRRPEPRI